MELILADIKNARYIKTDSIIFFPTLQNKFPLMFDTFTALSQGFNLF